MIFVNSQLLLPSSKVKNLKIFKLIFIESIAGIAVLIALFFSQSSSFSSFFSSVLVATSILPGFILASYSRKVVVGHPFDIREVKKLMIYCFVLNIFFAIFFLFLKTNFVIDYLLYLSIVLFLTATNISQILSKIWFYIYPDEKIFTNTKIILVAIKILGSILAIKLNLLVLVLAFNAFASIIEAIFGLKFSTRPTKVVQIKKSNNNDYLFGFSMGLGRLSNSIIKLAIEHYIGHILSKLIIFEQLTAGLIGLYERYLVRLLNHNYILNFTKCMLGIIFLAIILFLFSFTRDQVSLTIAIGLMALINLLPTSSSYNSIKVNGLFFLASNLIIISIFSIVLTVANYFIFKSSLLFIAIYTLGPILLLFLNLIQTKKIILK